MSQVHQPPGYWGVVRLLLRTSFRRAVGRRRRQRDLFRQRAARRFDFDRLGFVIGALVLAGLHVMTAVTLNQTVAVGARVAAERGGALVVDPWFIDGLAHPERIRWPGGVTLDRPQALDRAYRTEAAHIVQREGGDVSAAETSLRQRCAERGTAGLISIARLASGLPTLPRAGPLPPMLGSLLLLVWFVMMAFQGEGLELDIQRRRNPIWEWLFSHPVPQGAVFMAEMVSPLAANPIYFSAPLLPGVLFGIVYGVGTGVLATLVIGVPVTLAAACLGKAMEVAVTLRFAPRSRGAMIGIMGWLGYVTMLALVAAGLTRGTLLAGLAGALSPVAALPWPYLGWFLGLSPGGGFSLLSAILTDWLVCALVMSLSVWFSVWGAARGLLSQPGAGPAATRKTAQFGGDALYRKEILWFTRDRSALVQAVLIPVSVAGFQAFNLRGVLAQAGHQWNALCGAGVLFGTYFLVILGPKSLASEGAALWISLTWPYGLEKLLRAKARLWTWLATGLVGLVLIYAAVRFPADGWRIAALGIAWFLFARSMAAKAVTLATVTSESGEIQKVPTGRRWAAQLGLLTFAVGVLSAQWNLVVMGVVYSAVTAAAMWQNFRARLPYLYDPWSEVLPPPPTLMHAMIGISMLVEAGAVITGLMLVFIPRDSVAVAQAVVYGMCAAVVSVCVAEFLRRRGVSLRETWTWAAAPLRRRPWPAGGLGLATALALGAALGGALGVLALGYLALMQNVPDAAEQLRHSAALMHALPHVREAFFVMGVLIAPFAEEYLFRGLLYRALDREWGGWRAVLGSAAFFAAYHPMLSWPPVFLLGAANALLFRRTGRLAAAVVLHMTYNAVVLAG